MTTFSPVDADIIAALTGQSVAAIAESPAAQMIGRHLIRDTLTGLYNRQYFQRRLALELALAAERHASVALMMIDLDGFKPINDTFGHTVGDRALVAVSAVLARLCSDAGVAARYGGDEFVVALPGQTAAGARELGLRVLAGLEQVAVPTAAGRPVAGLKASIGVHAITPGGAGDYALLLESADQAMYIAKRQLNGGVCLFSALGGRVASGGARPAAAGPGVRTLVVCQPETAGAGDSLARTSATASSCLQRYGGLVFRQMHRSRTLAAFASADDALSAALALREASDTACLAMHTGDVDYDGCEYTGQAVTDACLLADLARGGDLLLSGAAAEHLGPARVPLSDLGTHRLRDLSGTLQVFQAALPEQSPSCSLLKSLGNLPNNLPAQPTRFIGRQRELAEVRHLLGRARLLTLVGAGGTGKTRLALQAAADQLDRYGDGAWFVDLAAITDPAGVPMAVTTALGGVPVAPGQSLAAAVLAWLRPKQLLLILDNCEHLITACASLAADIARTCPRVQVLATSREPLSVAAESVWHVPCLPEDEGIRLFAERAAAANPGCRLSPDLLPAVAEICRRLDGIPLAIELAAARVRALTVPQILERMGDRFRFLTTGSRNVLPRQQTLRALVDWSHDLLSEHERLLWRRFSVFAGGFSLDAAEGVAAGDGITPGDVLNLLTALVDKSLLVVDDAGGAGRYRMLETIRQYGCDRLVEAGEEPALRRRHADWYIAQAEALVPNLRKDPAAMAQVESQYDNFRAALQHALGRPDSACGLRMAAALGMFWVLRGWPEEGRELMARTLALPGSAGRTALRATALRLYGNLANLQSDTRTAMAAYTESLEIAREVGDPYGISACLNNLGTLAIHAADFERAATYFEASRSAEIDTDDRPMNLEFFLHNMGDLSHLRLDFAAAGRFAAEAAAVAESRGNLRIWGSATIVGAYTALKLGDMATAQALVDQVEGRTGGLLGVLLLGAKARLAEAAGDLEAARTLMARVMAEMQRGKRRESGALAFLDQLAELLVKLGRSGPGARLLAAVDARRRTFETPRPPVEVPEYESAVAALQGALSEADLAAEQGLGARMSVQEAVEFALSAASQP